jgi:hypothetical protein
VVSDVAIDSEDSDFSGCHFAFSTFADPNMRATHAYGN